MYVVLMDIFCFVLELLIHYVDINLKFKNAIAQTLHIFII
jgi:hypothetical protein